MPSMQEVPWNLFLAQYILGLKDVYNLGTWGPEEGDQKFKATAMKFTKTVSKESIRSD